MLGLGFPREAELRPGGEPAHRNGDAEPGLRQAGVPAFLCHSPTSGCRTARLSLHVNGLETWAPELSREVYDDTEAQSTVTFPTKC